MTTETIAYRKPKAIPTAFIKHPDFTTREYAILKASQEYGVPNSLMEELSGMTKNQLYKCIHNDDTVPLECIRKTQKMLDAVGVAADLQVLPTTDYGTIRNTLAMCYTILNLEEDLANAKQ
jgi:hypothetical protein